MYDIQNRWKLEGSVLQYYGLRSSPTRSKTLKYKNKLLLEYKPFL